MTFIHWERDAVRRDLSIPVLLCLLCFLLFLFFLFLLFLSPNLAIASLKILLSPLLSCSGLKWTISLANIWPTSPAAWLKSQRQVFKTAAPSGGTSIESFVSKINFSPLPTKLRLIFKLFPSKVRGHTAKSCCSLSVTHEQLCADTKGISNSFEL